MGEWSPALAAGAQLIDSPAVHTSQAKANLLHCALGLISQPTTNANSSAGSEDSGNFYLEIKNLATEDPGLTSVSTILS